jgi:hypothetical protein
MLVRVESWELIMVVRPYKSIAGTLCEGWKLIQESSGRRRSGRIDRFSLGLNELASGLSGTVSSIGC